MVSTGYMYMSPLKIDFVDKYYTLNVTKWMLLQLICQMDVYLDVKICIGVDAYMWLDWK